MKANKWLISCLVLTMGLLLLASNYHATKAFLLQQQIEGFLPTGIVVQTLFTMALVGIGSFSLGQCWERRSRSSETEKDS